MADIKIHTEFIELKPTQKCHIITHSSQ